jgi:hypothetical protein
LNAFRVGVGRPTGNRPQSEEDTMHRKLILSLLLTLLATGVQAQDEQTRSVPIPISNPGFEDGAKGWRLLANATIVSDQAFAGKLTDSFTRYAVHVYRYAD